jgi:hypothetical protein
LLIFLMFKSHFEIANQIIGSQEYICCKKGFTSYILLLIWTQKVYTHNSNAANE